MDAADSQLLTDLAQTRQDIVYAQAALRAVMDDMKLSRLNIEMALVERTDGDTKKLGSNESDRKRAFDYAVQTSDEHSVLIQSLHNKQFEFELLEAKLAGMLDVLRMRELIVAEKGRA